MIELNRSRNNVVLSRRAVLEEERKEVREQILGRLQPGMVVEGKISNIVDFGAFVDLDGIDGLIHISELSWSHVNHPSEVLSVGETVRVKVLDIDRERQRISLGLKQTQEDPWRKVLDEYRQGDVLEGKVTKVVAFGAFVEIIPGVEGLVHISELAEHHVESPSEVVSARARRSGCGSSRSTRAPPDLAQRQARRVPESAAPGPDSARARRAGRAAGGAGRGPGPRRLRGGLPGGAAGGSRRRARAEAEPAEPTGDAEASEPALRAGESPEAGDS